MANIHGKNYRVYLDEIDFSGVGNNTAISLTTAMAETTNYNSSFVERLAGVTDWSVDVSGFYDADDPAAFDDNLNTTLSGSLIVGVFPNKPNDGEVGWEGTPYETDYSISGPVDGPVATTLNLTGSARLSRTIVLSSCAAMTDMTTCTGGVSDMGASIAAGSVAAFARITAACMAGGSIPYVALQGSNASDAAFVNYVQFNGILSAAASVGVYSGSVGRWLRGQWDATDASGLDWSFILSGESYS